MIIVLWLLGTGQLLFSTLIEECIHKHSILWEQEVVQMNCLLLLKTYQTSVQFWFVLLYSVCVQSQSQVLYSLSAIWLEHTIQKLSVYEFQLNVHLMLNFIFHIVHPVINVRNQLVGSPFEKDVTIECNVEASPKSINYWIKDVKDGEYNFYGL